MALTGQYSISAIKVMAMSSEQLLDNSISRYGLRSAHVMNMGQAVQAGSWVQALVPADVAEGDLQLLRRIETDLDVHHLYLLWHAREIVRVQVSGDAAEDGGLIRDWVDTVWWWIDPDDPNRVSFRWQADLAATLYFLRLERWPDTVLVRTAPKGSVDTFEVEGLGEPRPLQLVEAEWVRASEKTGVLAPCTR